MEENRTMSESDPKSRLVEQWSDRSLHVVNGRGDARIQLGDEHIEVPTIASIEHDLDGVNGWIEKFQLGRIQRNKRAAMQKAAASGDVAVLRATVAAQTKMLMKIAEAVAEGQKIRILARLKYFVEDLLRQARDDGHIALQRSLLRVAVRFASHLLDIERADLPANIKKQVFDDAYREYTAARAEIAAVEFGV
jgi:hypothetical protein